MCCIVGQAGILAGAGSGAVSFVMLDLALAKFPRFVSSVDRKPKVEILNSKALWCHTARSGTFSLKMREVQS